MSKSKIVWSGELDALGHKIPTLKNDYKVREFKVKINFHTYGCITKKEVEEKLNDILRENIMCGVFPNSDNKSFTIKEVGVK